MKPTEDLIHEHKAIKVMLGIMKYIADDIGRNVKPDSDDLEAIINFLRIFADKCHHGKEEEVLFPAMVAAGMPQKSGPIAVMLYDHTMGRKYIGDIESAVKRYRTGGPVQPVADGLFNYVDLLRGHILKEEAILFPMADKILSSGTQAELADRFNMIEMDVVGRGKHEEYHKLLETLSQKYHR